MQGKSVANGGKTIPFFLRNGFRFFYMIFEKILGNENDESFSEKLHRLSHKSLVDYIEIKPEDSFRRRMRMVSINGREYKLAIPRSQKIENGSILWLSKDFAVVIRILNGPKIRVTPKNITSAVRLGYHCGNLHWKTNFILWLS